MGRSPCCAKEGLNRGAWTVMEDKILTDYIHIHGEGKWKHLPKKAGLKRCGKSCRLRWLNYLRPGIKRGNITSDEEDLIIRLHNLIGNRWSLIAGRLPGRTDNEIKNYWNTIVAKKLQNQQIPGSHNQFHQNRPNPTKNDQTTLLNANDVHTELCLAEANNDDNGLAVAPPSRVVVRGVHVDGKLDLVPESTSEFKVEEGTDVLLDFEIDEQLLYDLLNADYYEIKNFDHGASSSCS